MHLDLRPVKSRPLRAIAIAMLTVALSLSAGCRRADDRPASGGVLLPEQAAYDVHFYDLEIEVDPGSRTIRGRGSAHVRVVDTLRALVIHLDPRLQIRLARIGTPADGLVPVAFEHRLDGTVWLELPELLHPGTHIISEITYDGAPRRAPGPPWDGGITWEKTPDGLPWIATSNQIEGCKLWWPCKDHPSDRADSARIAVTVPEPLLVASNGVLRGIDERDGTRTYEWFVPTPINNYAVALNIAPYDTVGWMHVSTGGETIPVTFWVLPDSADKARRVLPGFLDHLRFLEQTLGPYPFRAQKYGIAHTPYLGMEHQSIIAYGNVFGRHGAMGYDEGFDALHFHELAHEWYANLVSVSDWKDFWIHEGFATYLEALYAERLHGETAYHRVIAHFRSRIPFERSVALRAPATTLEMFGPDVYFRGALVLHSLRYLLGDEAFMTFLRRMAYPDPAMEEVTDGSHMRLTDSDEVIALAGSLAGRDLRWFFDVYLYQVEMPSLEIERTAGRLNLRWRVPGGLPFPMPVPVSVGGEMQEVSMTGGTGSIALPEGARVDVDPERWVFRIDGPTR
jgi:aminopeptidase N